MKAPAYAEVLFFQGQGERPRSRRGTVPQLFDQPEVQPTEGPGQATPVARKELSSGIVAPEPGDLVLLALDADHMTQDAAATRMGISGSLFNRQLQNLDNQHVSLQRLWKLTDKFWLEWTLMVLERRKLARVRRHVEVEL